MSVLPQLERDLIEAARHTLAGLDAPRDPGRSGLVARVRRSRARVLPVALVTLLASTTIALAATGVILTGTPVRPSDQHNPRVGVGVPAPGGSRLLPLRVADPEGGPPWGMRLVRTTRDELCLEIGRVQGGQLGELGFDEAFGNDGKFHPLPPSALPAIAPVGVQPEADARTSCQLAGKAVVAEHIGLDRSAADFSPHRARAPRRAFRDIYYGILGPAAVSVTYRLDGRRHTAPVLRGSGAYLIVARSSARDQLGHGGASIGTYGDLPPSGALSAITYRIGGRLCRRVRVMAPWIHRRIANQCPAPHWSSGPVGPRELHRPVHARLMIRHGVIWALDLSFSAPFAITGAGHEYSAVVSVCQGGGRINGGLWTGTGRSLDRDVARGETVHLRISEPFSDQGCSPGSVAAEVLYESVEGGGAAVVGRVTVRKPAGATAAPLPWHVRHEPSILRRLSHRPPHPTRPKAGGVSVTPSATQRR